MLIQSIIQNNIPLLLNKKQFQNLNSTIKSSNVYNKNFINVNFSAKNTNTKSLKLQILEKECKEILDIYGAENDTLPTNLNYPEKLLFITKLLLENEDKLSEITNDTPNNILETLQNETGDVNNNCWFNFIENILQLSKDKCSEQDIIDSIKVVRNDYGYPSKGAMFIAILAWGTNTLKDAVKKVSNYKAK